MARHRYFAHGVCLESDASFPEFIPYPSGQPEIELSVMPAAESGTAVPPEAVPVMDGYYNRIDGKLERFAMYGLPSEYLLKWDLLCDFVVARDGSRISCHPWSGVPWHDIRQFLLGRVLPLALNLRQVVTLHAGGVLVPGGAIGLVAGSGTGKSTLIATFASLGFPLVSDDVLAIREDGDGVCVSPGSSYVRLRRESLEFLGPRLPTSREPEPDFDKSRVYLAEGRTPADAVPTPLLAIYFLKRTAETDGCPEISSMELRDALPLLLGNTTNASLLENPQLVEQFGILSRLVRRVPVRRMVYPSRFDALPGLCEALLSDQGIHVDLRLPATA